VRDLQCQRGERVLFAPTSFVVRAGAIVWIRGANGQGKTTLLRTLAGLSAPAAGELAWAGARPSRRGRSTWRTPTR
jgi:ABC-type transport system involved in cytochrome c biogenesis, ATPase component